MSIRKKHIIRHYTLIEVMVAMGIFLIMMTIMMQFFTSAQQMWNTSSKRNNTYANARVAMNLMTREIQCMLYRNDETDGSGIYPFWFEWTDRKIAPAATTPLTENYNVNYLTVLNFIAYTDLKSVEQSSDIFEIRYKFIPVYFTTATPTSISEVRGGKLQRSCTEEYYNDAGTIKLTNVFELTKKPYNFSEYYYRGDITTVQGLTPPNNDTAHQKRVATIWRNDSEDLVVAPFQTIISGVYSLRFSCYVWNGSQLAALDPMDRTSPGQNPAGGAITTPIAYDLAMGTPVPVAVRIDMKLLAPEDLKKLAFAIYNSDTKQIKTLKQKMRTFSKVIYLGKREE